jgi:hypothetical protein
VQDGRRVRRFAAGVVSLVTGASALVGAAAPSQAESTTAVFTPMADTYVSSGTPTTSRAGSTTLRVDSNPVEAAYLRFDLSALTGRTITSVRLQLRQKNSSPSGGRVHTVSSADWPETMTYDTRVPVDGPVVAEFPAVTADVEYDVDVTAALRPDGQVSLAIVGASTDSSIWYSRESKNNRPRLVVTHGTTGDVVDGLSTVAGPTAGSSDPTYFSTNHRVAVTEGGRLLAVHGLHATGVQLAWRDPADAWQTATRGERSDGILLLDNRTGDWPTSIALARDSQGSEVAFVVWAGTNFTTARSLQGRRLTELDSPDGPVLGPLVTLEAPGLGAARPDIQIETDPATGTSRAAVLWYRRAASTSYELVTAWLDSLDTATPALLEPTVLYATTSSTRSGTLVAGADGGMRALARSASGRLVQWRHDPATSLTAWSIGSNGPVVAGFPAAAALADGTVVAVAETDLTNHVVAVHRYGIDGVPGPAELDVTGYVQPTITTDGQAVWVVMLRLADGALVSRRWAAGAWSTEDRVELGPEAGAAAYPNALRQADGRLRLIVQGPTGDTSRSAVLAYQRLLAEG